MSNQQETETTVTTPAKLAVSINKNFYPFILSIENLINSNVFVAQRPECETDLTALQLIPYITLVDDSGPDLKYFVYTRGKASGEQRLAGKCSIGLGGHIETIENTDGYPNALVNSVCMTAVRELQEEVGLRVGFNVFANAMVKGYCVETTNTKNNLYIKSAKLLYNTLTPTDAVHLGISFVVRASQSDIKNLELDVITRGRWMTYEQIERSECSDNPIELELWSKTVIARVNLKQMIK